MMVFYTHCYFEKLLLVWKGDIGVFMCIVTFKNYFLVWKSVIGTFWGCSKMCGVCGGIYAKVLNLFGKVD